jgi:hypothetical protein
VAGRQQLDTLQRALVDRTMVRRLLLPLQLQHIRHVLQSCDRAPTVVLQFVYRYVVPLAECPQTCVQCALGAEAATDMRTVLTTACGEEPLPPSPSPARAAPADGCLTFLYGSETQTFDGVPPAKVQPP